MCLLSIDPIIHHVCMSEVFCCHAEVLKPSVTEIVDYVIKTLGLLYFVGLDTDSMYHTYFNLFQ